MSVAPPLQRAFVLHARPYRETSALLEVLSEQDGRVSLVARGVRGPKSKTRALLQPFCPLVLSFAGRGELLSLQQVEAGGMPYFPATQPLLSGFYLNELLVRLLHRHDPHPEIFTLYEQTLAALARGEDEEVVLRLFELTLLDALGYGVALDCDERGAPVHSECCYRFAPERGLVRTDAAEDGVAGIFSGEHLLRLASRDFGAPATRLAAKRLMRRILANYLGDKPLKSRALFRKRQ